MASTQYLLGTQRLIDRIDDVSAGTIAFYYTGTSNLAPIYADSAMTIPAANPVVIGTDGNYGNLYVDNSITYRRVITYADGSTDTADPLALVNDNTMKDFTNALVTIGSTTDTVANFIRPLIKVGDTFVNVNSAGIPNNGSVVDMTKLQAIVDASAGARIYFPGPYYRFPSTLYIKNSYTTLFSDGPEGCNFQQQTDFGTCVFIRNSNSGAPINGVELNNIKFNPDVRPSTGSAIYAEAANYLRLKNIEIAGNGAWIGVILAGCLNADLDQPTIKNPVNSGTGRVGLYVTKATAPWGGGPTSGVTLTRGNIGSVWDPSQVGNTPGMDIALSIDSADGFWSTDSYFGSTSSPVVKVNNISGTLVTDISLTGGRIDHGTSLGLQLLGTTHDNFGDFRMTGTRMYGGSASGGGFEILGNAKDVTINGCQINYYNGHLGRVNLTGNGHGVTIADNSFDYPNIGAGGFYPLSIFTGDRVNVTGNRIRGRNQTAFGISVEGGAGHVINANIIEECTRPGRFLAPATGYIAQGNNLLGNTTNSFLDTAGAGLIGVNYP